MTGRGKVELCSRKVELCIPRLPEGKVELCTPPARELFGVPIRAMNLAGVMARIDDAIARRRGKVELCTPLLIGVVNAAKIVNMRRNEDLRQSVLAADLILADGMSIVWAARLLGWRLPERIAGIDLMVRMLERSNERGYRVFCLGATEEVVGAVASRMAIEYPHLRLVGHHHGFFARDDERSIVGRIVEAEPDILFVAMSSPKKEEFLARWSHVMSVPVCHGVGGSFDVLAGKVRRAPRIWQRCGMEWLYRVVQEPRRMWRRYLVTNTIFCGMVVRALVAAAWPGQSRHGGSRRAGISGERS